MSGHAEINRVGATKAVMAVAALAFLLFAIWLFNIYDRKYHVCVPLKNGLNLGYEAVFDLSRPFLKPIAVPKRPDGAPLIRDETWEIFVTDTSIYGLAMGPSSAEDYRFVWRADAGLIRQQDNPSAYEDLIAEAGHANWDIEVDAVSTGWLLADLLRRQQPGSLRCPTSLFTW